MPQNILSALRKNCSKALLPPSHLRRVANGRNRDGGMAPYPEKRPKPSDGH